MTATTPPSPADGLPAPRRYTAILALSLGTILTTVDGTIVNVALPTLARDLGATPSASVLVVTVYQLVTMMALLPCSAIGDRIGHRTLYQYGQALFVIASLLCFFAESLPFLVLVRGFQALGAAAALSVAPAMIRAIYPADRLGRGLSLNTLIASVAASIAPAVGGAILTVASWPWLFAAVVPFGVFSILIGRKALPEAKRNTDPFDTAGAVLCAATFGLSVFGLESAVNGDSPVVSAAMVLLGVAVGTVYLRRARGQPRPVLPVDLLRIRAIALPCLGSLAAYLGLMMLSVALPFRLQQFHGFSPVEAGAALAPLPVMSIVVAPLAGLLSDRYPAGLLGAIGMTIGTAGLVLLALLPGDAGNLDVIWRVGVVGLGFGMFFSPNARQIVAAAPLTRTAAAGALFSTTRGLGQTLGATTIAALLALGLGAGPVPALVAAGLALVAGICSLAVLGPRPPAKPDDNAELEEALLP